MNDSTYQDKYMEGRKQKMNAKRLSKRLQVVASFVGQGTVLADIGSDHAYLPCWLIQNEQILRAIAGEVVQGPYESAQRNVAKEGLSSLITVRMANGLQAIKPGDNVETVSIAGMGGTLITSILDNDKDRLDTVERIVVQPNIHAIAIREWASTNSWYIVDEAIVKEDEKIYEVIVLERGERKYLPEEYLMGPILLQERSESFVEKWKRELEEVARVWTALSKSTETVESNMKRTQLSEMKELIERMLNK